MWIKSKKGMKQGDPFSPYFFLMVAECLVQMSKEVVRNKLVKGIDLFGVSRVILIQYQMTLFFFCEARKKYMKNLKFLWHLFEWVFGLKVNREKLILFYSG